MTYNVQNLFDTKHDADKNDFTFLPLVAKQSPAARQACLGQDGYRRRIECLSLDWNETILHRKLERLTEVIHASAVNKPAPEAPPGPDILVLQEVENAAVLERWVAKHLTSSKYQTRVLIEGRDPRGIDVAVLSRLPLKGRPHLHPAHSQRGILEVPLVLPNREILKVFAFHFPSQAASVAARERALISLTELIRESRKNFFVIAAGDSNITEAEEHRHGLLRKHLGALGQVSHWLGCADCPGTYRFRGRWSFLDLIFFDNALVTKGARIAVDRRRIRLVRTNSNQMDRSGAPRRFDGFCRSPKCKGASDHLPIMATLIVQ